VFVCARHLLLYSNVEKFDQDDDKKAGGAQYDGSVADTKVPDDLFTSRGLQPSYRDLDQIFDNSDDTSSDETVSEPAHAAEPNVDHLLMQHQVQTPPGSNKPPGDEHSITLVKPPRGSGGSTGGTSGTLGCGAGILRAEELSKMFPTPPSLEHNPIASPCGQPDVTMLDASEAALVPRIKQESYPNMGSPQEENIDVSRKIKNLQSCGHLESNCKLRYSIFTFLH
jgi:mediator of RNA polymerase II transcription subunit 13